MSAFSNTTPLRSRLLFAGALLLLCALSLPVLAVDTEPPFQDPVKQERYEQLLRELRCPQCQNNAIADSPSLVAGDLRREVHEMVAAGKSDAEIRAFLTTRYGDFILYRPPVTRDTLLLWAAPAILLAIGMLVAFRVVSRRARLVAGDTDEPDDAAGGA